MADRPTLARAFAERSGWAGAEMHFLAGDASARRYYRLTGPRGCAVLMDAPPGQGEEIAPFVAIARHLTSLGLSAPQVLAEDAAQGFLLLEDLGDGLYARLLDADPGPDEIALYQTAVEVLAVVQAAPAPPGLPDLTAADWAEATRPALDWYARAIAGTAPDGADLLAAMGEALQTHADGSRVLILRDYHAENLLWLPDRAGVARVGLLDFQLAQMGQPGYDLVSLCQDARRDPGPGVAAAAVRHHLDLTGQGGQRTEAALAVLGAQRALRILGIFARLCLAGGKPGYVALIPRVWGHLEQNLAHPALAGLAPICHRLLPAPTPERLERIRAQCGQPCP
jgi:aminoglycoside/choline kinase family phosphotransferase